MVQVKAKVGEFGEFGESPKIRRELVKMMWGRSGFLGSATIGRAVSAFHVTL